MEYALGHSDVRYFPPGGLYHVPGERFWQLHEQHAESMDAELIAWTWTAAEAPVFTDECYAACNLRMLARSYMRYWEAFPRGNYVVEALTIAATRCRRARWQPIVPTALSQRVGAVPFRCSGGEAPNSP